MPSPKDSLVNSLLGPGSFFKGDLVVDGFVRVDGDMEGSIRASGKIVISEASRCNASIVARSAVIGGTVNGDVCVTEKLVILEGGAIIGNVFTPSLDADGEILIHGDVEVPGPIEKAEEAMLAFIHRHGSSLKPYGFGSDTAGGKAWQA